METELASEDKNTESCISQPKKVLKCQSRVVPPECMPSLLQHHPLSGGSATGLAAWDKSPEAEVERQRQVKWAEGRLGLLPVQGQGKVL